MNHSLPRSTAPANDARKDEEIRCLREKLSMQDREIARLRELSDTDPLTGIANRRRFNEELNRCIAEFDRLDRKFCLVLLDVDCFKEINDAMGHGAGDRVLETLAHALREHIRTTDFVARIGGDEFAILLTGVELAEARAVSKRLRNSIARLITETAGVPSVSLSSGVAAMSRDLDAGQLMHLADQSLYRNKNGSGDIVVRESS